MERSIFLVWRRCALSLNKAAMIQNYKFSNLSTPCTALFEALYSAAKMGIMACKTLQCVLRNTLLVREKKNSCFEQSPLNYLFRLLSHEISQKIK
jgi:hypothetical protein